VRGFAFLIVILMMGGLLVFVSITDHVDRRRSRKRTVRRELPMLPKSVPPFIYDDTQCRQCGLDSEPLSLGEKLCLVCHEVKYG
jgi:hypothetical protein